MRPAFVNLSAYFTYLDVLGGDKAKRIRGRRWDYER